MILSDVLVYKTIEVFLIHFLVFDHVKPRLKRVVTTLREIMFVKFQSAAKCTYFVNPVEARQKKDLTSYDVDMRAVQHLSGVCRAARSSGLSHLPAAQLLLRLDDVDIHMLRRAANGNKRAGKHQTTQMDPCLPLRRYS